MYKTERLTVFVLNTVLGLVSLKETLPKPEQQ